MNLPPQKAMSDHIRELYTTDEIRARIASNDYSAEILLQHAMVHIDRLEAVPHTPAPVVQPVVPPDVLKAAQSFVANDYRGPLAWAKKVFDWVVAVPVVEVQPEQPENPLGDASGPGCPLALPSLSQCADTERNE